MPRRAKKILAAAAAVLCLFGAAGCSGVGTRPKPEQTPLYAMLRMPEGQVIEGPANGYYFSGESVLLEFSDGSSYKTSIVNCCLFRNAPGAE